MCMKIMIKGDYRYSRFSIWKNRNNLFYCIFSRSTRICNSFFNFCVKKPKAQAHKVRKKPFFGPEMPFFLEFAERNSHFLLQIRNLHEKWILGFFWNAIFTKFLKKLNFLAFFALISGPFLGRKIKLALLVFSHKKWKTNCRFL